MRVVAALIESALSDLNLDIARVYNPSPSTDPYIIYNQVTKSPSLFTDNCEQSRTFLIINNIRVCVVNVQGEILLNTMKSTIRVDTGRTRDSLKASGILTAGGERKKLVGAYKSNRAHIVRYLERGCAKWKGKKYPFLRPSYYKCRQEMIEQSKEIIQKELMKD